MDYQGRDTGYMSAEVAALVAPLFGLSAEEVHGVAVVVKTTEGKVKVASNANGATRAFDLLTAAQVELVRRLGLAIERGELAEPEPDAPNPLADVPADTDALLRAIFGEEV
jgi:hypothetical protein